jgi:hypothetical protein
MQCVFTIHTTSEETSHRRLDEEKEWNAMNSKARRGNEQHSTEKHNTAKQ